MCANTWPSCPLLTCCRLQGRCFATLHPQIEQGGEALLPLSVVWLGEVQLSFHSQVGKCSSPTDFQLSCNALGIIESQNYQRWKRPPRSSSPTVHLSPTVLAIDRMLYMKKKVFNPKSWKTLHFCCWIFLAKIHLGKILKGRGNVTANSSTAMHSATNQTLTCMFYTPSFPLTTKTRTFL